MAPDLIRRDTKRLTVSDPGEISVIECKPKRIAESGKGSLGRIGFRSLER